MGRESKRVSMQIEVETVKKSTRRNVKGYAALLTAVCSAVLFSFPVFFLVV